MIRDFARLITLSVIMALVAAGAARPAQAFVDDVHGKEWRQLTETVGLSWDQVAQVCPQDGASACVGSVGGIDLTDWVWASDSQTIELFSYFEPDILTSPVVSGQKYFFTATTFMNAFQPTFSMALTYQAAAQAAGWTSSTDPTGVPVAGAVSWGTTSVSIGGQFGVEPMSSPGVALGVFLWRATGLGTGAAYAYDDVGQLASPAGGTAVANVLANDWIGGAPATTDNVTLFQLSSTNPRVTLDILDGSVDAAAGVEPGTHSLVYRICQTGNPDNCDDAMVKVTVKPYVIDAVNDQGSVSPATGGRAVASVLGNDTLGGLRATTATVSLSTTSISPATEGITLNLADGSVDVARGTPIGTYVLAYGICEIANPTNCDQATATVTVKENAVTAVNDSVRASSKTGGKVIASVLANDSLAGARATTSNVTLALVSLTPATTGIKLDVTNGSVNVAPKTNSGLYSLVYQICEIASPTNCAQATVTIDLSGGGKGN